MLDWNETEANRAQSVESVVKLVNRLVRSMPQFTFRDGVTLNATASGESIAHGGNSVPKRVYAEITSDASAAPVLQVGSKDKRHVILLSSANTVANLTFLF